MSIQLSYAMRALHFDGRRLVLRAEPGVAYALPDGYIVDLNSSLQTVKCGGTFTYVFNGKNPIHFTGMLSSIYEYEAASQSRDYSVAVDMENNNIFVTKKDGAAIEYVEIVIIDSMTKGFHKETFMEIDYVTVAKADGSIVNMNDIKIESLGQFRALSSGDFEPRQNAKIGYLLVDDNHNPLGLQLFKYSEIKSNTHTYGFETQDGRGMLTRNALGVCTIPEPDEDPVDFSHAFTTTELVKPADVTKVSKICANLANLAKASLDTHAQHDAALVKHIQTALETLSKGVEPTRFEYQGFEPKRHTVAHYDNFYVNLSKDPNTLRLRITSEDDIVVGPDTIDRAHRFVREYFKLDTSYNKDTLKVEFWNSKVLNIDVTVKPK